MVLSIGHFDLVFVDEADFSVEEVLSSGKVSSSCRPLILLFL
jgi:hypothetical protein